MWAGRRMWAHRHALTVTMIIILTPARLMVTTVRRGSTAACLSASVLGAGADTMDAGSTDAAGITADGQASMGVPAERFAGRHMWDAGREGARCVGVFHE